MRRTHLTRCPLVLALAVLLLGACGDFEPRPLNGADEPLIYLPDDRKECSHASGTVENALCEATVALIDSSLVQQVGDVYRIDATETFAEYIERKFDEPLCQSEPYRDQPNPAHCSGFVVAHDLVATAGHCMNNRRECENTWIVLGFHMPVAEGYIDVPASQVRRCTEIVGRKENWTNDWAVVRLDDSVSVDPLPLRRSGELTEGVQLMMVGHPVGLPGKLVTDGEARDTSHPQYFQADLDAYGGNSGSAVVSHIGGDILVEGILVRGNTDFVSEDGCIESATCDSAEGCEYPIGWGWEEATRTVMFAEHVPEPTVCGNDICEDGEDCASCEDDCGACPVCGNDECEEGECDSCPDDCTSAECPECLPKGDPCTSGEQCCSGRCHPQQDVCK